MKNNSDGAAPSSWPSVGRDIFKGVAVALISSAILYIPFQALLSQLAVSFVPQPLVPVGAIIAYWGSVKSGPPDGYELCDGGQVQTGPLRGMTKPNLQDSFLKGATRDILDVTAKPSPESKNFKDLSHTHSAGSYRALIGPHGSDHFFSWVSRGQGFSTERQMTVSQGAMQSGGQPSNGVALDGDSGLPNGDALKNFDVRPQFVSVHYLIRVR